MNAETIDADLERVFIERAKELARAPGDGSSAAAGEDHLVFTLGDLRFAIDIASVATVLRAVVLTRVPCAPPETPVVFHAGGRVIAVADLGVLVDRPASAASATRVIVLTGAADGLAVAASAVDGLAPLDLGALADTERSRGRGGASPIVGVGPEMTLVVSGERLARWLSERAAGQGDARSNDAGRTERSPRAIAEETE